MKRLFDGCVALTGTLISFLLGEWDLPIAVLVCFMAADYVTGVLLAISRRELSSAVGFKGIAKKAAILLVIVLAVLLDRLTHDGSWTFRTLTAYFYLANEGISLLENAGNLGVPIPEKLRCILAQLNARDT